MLRTCHYHHHCHHCHYCHHHHHHFRSCWRPSLCMWPTWSKLPPTSPTCVIAKRLKKLISGLLTFLGTFFLSQFCLFRNLLLSHFHHFGNLFLSHFHLFLKEPIFVTFSSFQDAWRLERRERQNDIWKPWEHLWVAPRVSLYISSTKCIFGFGSYSWWTTTTSSISMQYIWIQKI